MGVPLKKMKMQKMKMRSPNALTWITLYLAFIYYVIFYEYVDRKDYIVSSRVKANSLRISNKKNNRNIHTIYTGVLFRHDTIEFQIHG